MNARPRQRIEFGVAILLVISLLLEGCGAAPARDPADSRQAARMLLLAMHSLMLGEEDAENARVGLNAGGVLLRSAVRPTGGSIDEVKAAIVDLEAQCAQARVEIENLVPEADKAEDLAVLDGICQAELSVLRKTLQDLRDAKNKSWWRRSWVGRSLASGWQAIKSKRGRRAIVVAALTGGLGLAKKAVIDVGRQALRRELKTALGRGLARKGVRLEVLNLLGLSPGAWPPARSGARRQVESDEAPAQAPAVEEDFSPTRAFELPADGLWTAVCKQRPCAGCGGEWAWTLTLNLMTRTFESHAEFNEAIPDPGGGTRYVHLVHEGVGEITDDGMLFGPYHEVSEQGWTGDEVSADVRENDWNQYGVISADLESICLSRGEDPGNYDIDYIRRIGREAYFGPDAGCEAECTITREP